MPAPIIEQYKNLRFHAARDTVLLIRTPAAVYKVARITFGRDGSLYVQFPYCVEKQGWIGELPIAPGVVGTTTYSMADHGAYVGTDVKFSHHRSGIALFSKTGQEVPATRRRSFPLDGPIGHLFNLQVSEPTRFERLTKGEKSTKYLALDLPDSASPSVSWRAEWRRKDSIVANIEPAGSVAGPQTKVRHRKTGVEEEMLFLGQPEDFAMRDHVMLLTAGPSAGPQGVVGSGMTFLGGWNVHETTDSTEPADLGGCLAFLYPARAPSQT